MYAIQISERVDGRWTQYEQGARYRTRREAETEVKRFNRQAAVNRRYARAGVVQAKG